MIGMWQLFYVVLLTASTHVKAEEDVHKVLNGRIINPKYHKDINHIIRHEEFDEFVQKAVERNDVTFYLYKKGDVNYTKIDFSYAEALNFQVRRKTIVFLIHGWGQNRENDWYKEITNNFFLHANGGVIQVDWSGPADESYVTAASSVEEVGSIIGEFIVKIHNDYRINLDNVAIVGHSLGAHVAGFAGKYVYNDTQHKIAKIFALDPAGPFFFGNNESERLSNKDARSVVVLHTDGGVFGFSEAIGTVDFYPNGGIAPQPGCMDYGKMDLKAFPVEILCSHQRAYKLFGEALKNPPGFIGTMCESYADYKNMKCDKNKKLPFLTDDLRTEGSFYFDTKAESPYVIWPTNLQHDS